MTRTKNQRKNGHAGPQSRPNGHAPASAERGGVPLLAHAAGGRLGPAASDDASGVPVASAAALEAAAGTARTSACADAAPPRPPDNTKLRDAILAGATEPNAMQDGSSYVDAVAARVDLVAASIRLVSSEDEKIAKAELDRLREMKFGKVGPAAGATEAQTVVWDIPGVSPLKDER